jgi:hypothetical protein
MRMARIVLSTFISFLLSISLAAQQTATSSPQALQFLQRSLSALAGSQPLSDVTLSGTARRIAGSDDESGTVTLKALASGASRVDLNLPSGQRTEVHNLIASTPTGSWSGPDTVSHVIAYHNLLAEPSWFFPAFAISRRLSGSGFVATYVGHEVLDGQAVEHVSVSRSSSQDSPGAPTLQHLTQIDFFLDSGTLLPAAITLNIHPDHNALLDIPIEVRFSDYRPVNGAQIPFHVQKFTNNSLALDFQGQSVTLNAGLSAADFVVAGLKTGSSSGVPVPPSCSGVTR